MTSKANSTIRREIGLVDKNNRIVEVCRERIDRHPLTGYVVATSADFVVLHCMNDAILMDGYSLICVRDITKIEKSPVHASFYEKALKLRNEKPKQPKNLCLGNMYSVLRSLDENYPLISLEREKIQSDECAVGRIHMLSEHTAIFKWLTPDAKWEGNSPRYRLTDITKIDFDSSYLNALALVAQVSINNN